ncbi:hypothetical protein QBZ16_002354 [Prototheca wickerhamii]|uniref:Uncharacterized protein n=1 Tax=Prototheca wickerhamii TaxID=3111 RepID=A0AAD9IMI5_PROWI|nr:hypothetical protein QBZ16_002354 [Prototheca wickerhamii]
MQVHIRGAELRAATAKLLAGSQSPPAPSPPGESSQDPAFLDRYEHALQLQELAHDQPPASQRASLLAACEAYREASALAEHTHVPTLYNLAVALSDLARLEPPGSDAAAGWLHQATRQYAAVLALDPLNPQALNNSGLLLQESAGYAAPETASGLLEAAAARFRAALRVRPAFHQALYNLGTTLYSLASVSRAAAGIDPAALLGGWATSAEGAGAAAAARAGFARAGIPILLACAAVDAASGAHQRRVYMRSVRVVARLMPLPALARAPGAFLADGLAPRREGPPGVGAAVPARRRPAGAHRGALAAGHV